MSQWRRRLRGAAGMGLIWAAGGAALGGVFELIDNVFPGALPFISRLDMWPQTLAIPGFLGGVLFATLLGIVGGRHRFDELSLPRFVAWGAVAGVVLGGLAMAIGAPIAFVGITTLLSAAGAGGSLVIARIAEKRELVGAGSEVSDAGLTVEESRELLGGRE